MVSKYANKQETELVADEYFDHKVYLKYPKRINIPKGSMMLLLMRWSHKSSVVWVPLAHCG